MVCKETALPLLCVLNLGVELPEDGVTSKHVVEIQNLYLYIPKVHLLVSLFKNFSIVLCFPFINIQFLNLFVYLL